MRTEILKNSSISNTEGFKKMVQNGKIGANIAFIDSISGEKYEGIIFGIADNGNYIANISGDLFEIDDISYIKTGIF